MDIEARYSLLREVGQEIVTEEELRDLLSKKSHFIAYDGFEPSGNMHIAQGIMRSININKVIRAGGKFKMLVADWHAWANNKLGGDLENIRTVGEYYIEIWKASGMNLEGVEFIWANDLLKEEGYWEKVMKIAVNSTVKRVLRCSQIMGRSESDSLSASQIFYPCMQAADIFQLKADICQLGMDQRKVNVLARELGPKLGFYKPVIISHRMLPGLMQPPAEGTAEEKALAMKMSKTRPDTAIFMTDSEQEVTRKIQKAYCPEKVVEENPVLEYCRHIVFEKFGSVEIKRPEKYGGNLSFEDYALLEKDFREGNLHPMDLKAAVAYYLNEILKPVRQHFEKNMNARKLMDKVLSLKVTR